MINRTTLFCLLAAGILASLAPMTFAQEVEAERPDKAICTVCTRRGATHGAESVAAWRQFEDADYAFCSEPCAEAFDQMPEGYAAPKLPRPAPSAVLTDLEGEPFDLVTEGSRATLVDFWATWCKPCLETMPALSRLFEERADEGVRVVGISIDEDRSKLDSFLRKKAPAYPVVHDDGEDPAWWAYRVPAIPSAFLIDATGQIVAQWGADLTEEAVRQAVDDLLEE